MPTTRWWRAGLHVCFPYHHHLLRLLDALGASHRIAWTAPSFSDLRAGGDVAQLRFPRLPAPLHGALAIARFGHISLGDRLSAIVGAAEATLSSAGWRQRYESISFADWARQRGLASALLATVIEPMIGGLTFLRPDQVSARAMLAYIHAIGSHAGHCRTGLFRAGSGEVIIDPLAADVRRHGGESHTGAAVASLAMVAGRVVGAALANGSLQPADLEIAAVPSHALQPLLPDAALLARVLADLHRVLPARRPAAAAQPVVQRVWQATRARSCSKTRNKPYKLRLTNTNSGRLPTSACCCSVRTKRRRPSATTPGCAPKSNKATRKGWASHCLTGFITAWSSCQPAAAGRSANKPMSAAAMTGLRLFALAFPFGRVRYHWICSLFDIGHSKPRAARRRVRRAIVLARRFGMPVEALCAAQLLAGLVPAPEQRALQARAQTLAAALQPGWPALALPGQRGVQR